VYWCAGEEGATDTSGLQAEASNCTFCLAGC
ncbi:hypothetical protein LINPERPRIM_LOCUS31574, partial [Linum perenne]